jgi:hypothetical protein
MDKKTLYFFATLAEECGELAQMCGKSIRFRRNDKKNVKLIEELSDIVAVACLLGIKPDEARVLEKMKKLTEQALCYEAHGTGDCQYVLTEQLAQGQKCVDALNARSPGFDHGK